MLRQAKRNASHAEQRNKDDIMDIAKIKRRENIAEYILYLWQLEDLLRALQFSPEAVHSQLIAPRDLSQPEQRPTCCGRRARSGRGTSTTRCT